MPGILQSLTDSPRASLPNQIPLIQLVGKLFQNLPIIHRGLSKIESCDGGRIEKDSHSRTVL
ncbi:MAG: hypothetical protein ACI814_003148 [Mariniblastus sp.]|jgi:hypothetical protein